MEHFKAGLQVYMERHQYGNTETFHLWNAWEEVSGKPVAAVMGGWTEQMGFPLLEVTGREEKAGSVTLTVKQSWFLADGSEPDDRTWSIPMIAHCGAEGAPRDVTIMSDVTSSVSFPKGEGDAAWIKLNAGQHVPCRVAYDAESLAGLSRAVETMAIGPEDRAGLINDAFALAKAGHPSMPAT
eukprot:CAMPEP_0205917612 /NCGR_PEP_ID=MMETSP1325-20131115/9274_1 /ASSEMBLY_ACC=CAM_ASM_000708 /TAXON_ID=236786 /ORGANISM="Florenciella sp., Strain RCC1007" /LENGTH=182 /DNA_ID=CAMNT_0053285053 /DNA_START=72 /DNA_END=616 /DNA_ORIENTATION=-